MKIPELSNLKYWRLIVVILIFTGCSTDRERKPVGPKPIRKQTKVVSPSINQKIKLGEPIIVEVAPKNDSTKIDSVALFYQSLKVPGDGLKVSINSSETGVGIPRLVLNVYLDGGKKETHLPKVIVLPEEPTYYTYKVENVYPHDRAAYTQGLFIKEGFLYEGTGQNGTSHLRKLELTTGKVLQSVSLENKYFGEGITYLGDSIFQLTWEAQEAFVYNGSFEKIKTFQYPTEGWGITTVGRLLVMSDGSEYLYYRDPGDFSEVRKLMVYDHKGKVDKLNELEYIDGYIYANVYTTNRIVKIDPATGAVVGDLDLTGIFDPTSFSGQVDVLNGIAYDPDTEKIYVTGKLWPNLYEVSLLPKQKS